MRSNEAAFYWLMPVGDNAERRDYPMRGESLILSMTDVIWSPPYQHDSDHSHNCMEIGLCLEGRGTLHIGGQEARAYAPGTVVIVPEGVRHSQQSIGEEKSRWRYIAVDEARLLRETTAHCCKAVSRLTAISGGVILRDEEMAKDIVWLIQKMFEVKCRFADEATAQLEAMLLLILTRAAREQPAVGMEYRQSALMTKPIEPALLYIAEQYHTQIKVAQLARSCAMSESYFRRVFGEVMGESPVEYLNRYRIERAVNLIRERSGASILRIAEECGFPSISTFNRNFLKYVGQSPSEVKRGKTLLSENDAEKIVQNR